MLKITISESPTYYIVRSNDNTVVHSGFVALNNELVSGLDVLEKFNTEEAMILRNKELINK